MKGIKCHRVVAAGGLYPEDKHSCPLEGGSYATETKITQTHTHTHIHSFTHSLFIHCFNSSHTCVESYWEQSREVRLSLKHTPSQARK